MRPARYSLVLPLAFILCVPMMAEAKVFQFNIFDFNGSAGGSTAFFENYTQVSECSIEVDDTAIVPNAFIDFQGSALVNLSCTISGYDGRPYAFSYSEPNSTDQYEEDIFPSYYANSSFGLLLDADRNPKRFSGREDGSELNGTIGFYDSNGDEDRYGSSTSYFGGATRRPRQLRREWLAEIRIVGGISRV